MPPPPSVVRRRTGSAEASCTRRGAPAPSDAWGVDCCSYGGRLPLPKEKTKRILSHAGDGADSQPLMFCSGTQLYPVPWGVLGCWGDTGSIWPSECLQDGFSHLFWALSPALWPLLWTAEAPEPWEDTRRWPKRSP